MRRWGEGQAREGGGSRHGRQPESGPESRVRGGRKQESKSRVMGTTDMGHKNPKCAPAGDGWVMVAGLGEDPG